MRNFIEMARNKVTDTWEATKVYAGRAAAGGTALMASGAAFAGGGGGADLSAITTEINSYKVAVVALVIAFAVVLWSIRAAGLSKPR